MATAGKDTTFSIDDSGGTPRDISGYVTEVSGFEQVAASLDTTTMGSDSRTRIGGLKDCTFSVTCVWDDTADTGSDTVLSGIVGEVGTFSYKPDGTSPNYNGEALCTSYGVSSPVDGLVTCTAAFEVSGDVQRG